ncbi:MAG: Rossmann-like and DUF2520 domain-containing protein [Ferruginibacter sp.]
MRVVIIGAGNVATVFGRLIVKANHEILQVVSRNIDHAGALANELGCAFTDNPTLADPSADIYIVAWSDEALSAIHQSYLLGDKLIVHTAGSVSKDILKPVSVNYGVLYPLQSLRKENMELLQDIPLLIDGSSDEVVSVIERFSFSLSPVVNRMNDDQRLKLHLAAVIVSNFSNHLYVLAAGYCVEEGLDFTMLLPLIEETALRLRQYHPVTMQTGPAIRKDTTTIEKHLQLLSLHPRLKELYLRISDSIMMPDRGN